MSRATMATLQATLETLVANQVNKTHLDDKINTLEKRIEEQEKAITATTKKVEKIDKDVNEMPENIYSEIHEQEIRKKKCNCFWCE